MSDYNPGTTTTHVAASSRRDFDVALNQKVVDMHKRGYRLKSVSHSVGTSQAGTAHRPTFEYSAVLVFAT